MAIKYNTSIVRDGLVLCLDAANAKSYPGSGTIWYDLSGNGNNGTINSGEFVSDNGIKYFRNQNGVQTALGSMQGVLEYDTSENSIPCLNFIGYGDGSQGYLQFSNHPCGGFTSYSVESFFKITSLTPSAEYNVIFYSSHSDSSDQEFGLMAQNSISDPDVAIEINNAYTAGSSNIRASLGWHHFVLTFNGTTSVLYRRKSSLYKK